jgi:hypothetical protein
MPAGIERVTVLIPNLLCVGKREDALDIPEQPVWNYTNIEDLDEN